MRAPPALRRHERVGALVAALVLTGMAAQPPVHNDFSVLARIPAMQQILSRGFPTSYRVPVLVTGPMVDEMAASLGKMAYAPPRFEERFNRANGFQLVLANDDYPLETRSLVSGILNPTEMITTLLSSVLKYRDKQTFAALKNETTIQVRSETLGGRAVYRVSLRPRGDRFGYVYDDVGSFVTETWLSAIVVVVDTNSYPVHELTITKHSRTVAADQAKPPMSDTTIYAYTIGYDSVAGALLPSRMALSVNASPALELSVTYRTSGQYTVFDTRTICYLRPGQAKSCLSMKYGEYEFTSSWPSRVRTGVESTKYAKRLSKAATLSRKSLKQLKDGNIAGAVRTLHALVSDYAETPQGIEARRLLDGLPE